MLLAAVSPVWILVVTQTVLSIGLAMSFTPLFTASLGSLEPKYYSYGSATVSTVQQVAGAAGIAVLIAVMSSVSQAAVDSGAADAAAGAAGARAAFLLAAIIGTPLLISAFLIRKPADAPEGMRGSEGTHILAMQEERFLSITWALPPYMPEVREHLTHLTVRFEPVSEERTRVSIRHDGWGEGGQWEDAHAYFETNWSAVIALMQPEDGAPADDE